MTGRRRPPREGRRGSPRGGSVVLRCVDASEKTTARLELAPLHLLEELLALDLEVAILLGRTARRGQRGIVPARLFRLRGLLDLRDVLSDQLRELLVVHDNLLPGEIQLMCLNMYPCARAAYSFHRREESLRSHKPVGVLHELADFGPVGILVQADADPTARAYIGRHEEPVRV